MTLLAFRDRVPGAGDPLGAIRAQLWERFAAITCRAFGDALAILGRHGLGFDHTNVVGYWGTGSRKAKGQAVHLPLENGITDPLVRALELVRADAMPDSFIKQYQICFVQQQPRQKQKKVGSSAFTTDIQVRSLNVPELDLRVEAKVLFGGRDVKAYCGPSGLLRFADKEPYTDRRVGMMLGYSVRHDDAHWLKQIEQESASAPVVGSLEMLDLMGSRVGGTLVASHATGQVLVLHVMLPFETKPSARAIDSAPKPPKPRPS